MINSALVALPRNNLVAPEGASTMYSETESLLPMLHVAIVPEKWRNAKGKWLKVMNQPGFGRIISVPLQSNPSGIS